MRLLIQQTESFARWHAMLRDLKARIAIARRIERLAAGTLGDIKHVGGKISELRIDTESGYRLYFTMRAKAILVLLAGGEKHTQKADIRRAQRLAKEIASHG